MVPSSDDPLYIVPAVVPDDEPTTKPTSQTPPPRSSPPVPPPPSTSLGAEDITSMARSIRFERSTVRRTTRTIRYIDPWSVFRVALVAHLVLYVVFLLAGVLLWNVANATGTVDNVERFMESFGWESFEFKGGELFHQAWVLGLFAVVGFTGLAVLAVTTFNLITDLVGGIRLTVLENRPSRQAGDQRAPSSAVRSTRDSRPADQAVESERPHR